MESTALCTWPIVAFKLEDIVDEWTRVGLLGQDRLRLNTFLAFNPEMKRELASFTVTLQ